ncbi:hypothetical protein [Hirschia litorea]|uniref:Macro domain-containing protein n=1 Tax=Hirschia litorea TaxID=1199156 RepID=A0ABW2ILJ9_9PROT
MAGKNQTYCGYDEEDADSIDVILIAPYQPDERLEFDRFLVEVIGPAIVRVEKKSGRTVQVAVLNDLLENEDISHEFIYRVLHLADIAIADVSAANGELDARVLSAFSIRQSLTAKPAIPFTRDPQPRDYPFNLRGLVLNAASENARVNAQAVLFSHILAAFEGEPKGTYVSDVYASLSALRTDLRGSRGSAGVHPTYEEIGYQPTHSRPNVRPPRFEIAMGDLRLVKNVDVWINPENTHMEMARVFDTSISGIVRHMSSNWTNSGTRSDDYIRRKLAEEMKGEVVAPGAALMTSCKGQLRDVHFVKRVVHVAAVAVNDDDPGCGYSAIDDVGVCLSQALQRIQQHNLSWMGRGHNRLASVITPLLGVGSNPETAFRNVLSMLAHAVRFFDSNPDCLIERFIVLAYSSEDRRLIRKALKRIPQLQNLSASGGMSCHIGMDDFPSGGA